MFGDLYQLCPVADSEDKAVLKGGYQANEFYFFLSQALRNFDYRVIELQEIHRQDNRDFINLLNSVRVGEINRSDLAMLDSRVEGDFKPNPKNGILTLMTHNYQSRKLNNAMFDSLKTKEYPYLASIIRYTDLWHDKYPVDYKLRLKVGSRVMFQRNDSENSTIVNGTMGWVRRLTDDKVFVEIDGGDTVEVEYENGIEVYEDLDNDSFLAFSDDD